MVLFDFNTPFLMRVTPRLRMRTCGKVVNPLSWLMFFILVLIWGRLLPHVMLVFLSCFGVMRIIQILYLNHDNLES